jgi:hypothetical protein
MREATASTRRSALSRINSGNLVTPLLSPLLMACTCPADEAMGALLVGAMTLGRKRAGNALSPTQRSALVKLGHGALPLDQPCLRSQARLPVDLDQLHHGQRARPRGFGDDQRLRLRLVAQAHR